MPPVFPAAARTAVMQPNDTAGAASFTAPPRSGRGAPLPAEAAALRPALN
ncbi:hypothetical protein C7449_104294 [Mycoplana dimorpha]|uniref:Uncharacterized protein n=1 Tax=Mycoplana dimorpha TaxID=28320 RepID=A0A2T5B8A9_MYCDI|nr:hypothetical protein C7449_104294 [Mycoplana dimorpha]